MTNFLTVEKTLKTRRAELAERVSSIDSNLQAPLSADFEEQAGDLESLDSLGGIEAVALKEITAIDRALGRIANGTYGVCIDCGEPISQKRLDAVPTALRCVSCKV
jgi:RNA polymerase-binding transcription factor DksA